MDHTPEAIEAVSQAREFRGIPYAECEPVETHNGPVAGVLDAVGVSVMYGASGSGKTWSALDMSLRVASGLEWNGHATNPGAVVYVATEAGESLQNRVCGWRDAHPEVSPEIPFWLIPEPLDLSLEPDWMGIIRFVQERKLEQRSATGSHAPIQMIVIDTLARSMGMLDENQASDMGRVIATAESMATYLGCNVLLVHHTGKDEAKGARGSSALRAAIDSELSVSASDGGFHSITATKQRNFETGGRWGFRLEPITLTTASGASVETCVVDPIDLEAAEAAKDTRPPASPSESVILEAFELLKDDTEPLPEGIGPMRGWRGVTRLKLAEAIHRLDPDLEANKLRPLIGRLRKKGHLGTDGEWVWTL